MTANPTAIPPVPPVPPVPLVDLKAAHAEVADEVRVGFDRILRDTAFIKGAEVAAFEAEYAAFCGLDHCIGLANGTDAIELALRAIALPPGGEVVIPANTFVATAEAIIRAGGRPVCADVDPDTLLLDPVCAAKAVGPQTAAIVPVHLFGQIAPMEPLLEIAQQYGLAVVEDAAQSQGATQDGRPGGSWGVAAATSFYPGKNLGAYGDAGAVVTSSGELARTVRLLGDHGSERKYEHVELGFNSRMDGLQAVVLRAKLQRLAAWNQRRRAAAARYADLLADLPGVVAPQTAVGNEHVWHLYVIQVPERDRVVAALNERGIGAGIHYPIPVHLQPAFRQYGWSAGDFPVAERAAQRILSLPIYPQITPEQQRLVVDTLRDALAPRPGER
jgi:dTDP-4-amino-4,6-dideoxygalactose transaminase